MTEQSAIYRTDPRYSLLIDVTGDDWDTTLSAALAAIDRAREVGPANKIAAGTAGPRSLLPRYVIRITDREDR